MGSMLPKPVESTVVERQRSNEFTVGVAEMNGCRPTMEDAHVIHIEEDWAFFAVFDGHGGDKCAKFVARRFQEELKNNGCPSNDDDVKRLVFGIDKEFLDLNQKSGSTATMCIVHKPSKDADADADGKHRLRVINAGDSRVLLGHRDGTIFDGGGTDSGLTTDHKPNDPSEKERIYRCGGHVQEPTAAGGVARVNGDLAVSRGFGDAELKKSGGPGPEDHPVTADPELREFTCDESDFLVLVCDGAVEGDSNNPLLVKLVADCLAENPDPAFAAKAVCHKAVELNSKDNITCMVVLLQGGEAMERQMKFHPGPISVTDSKPFLTAWTAMAAKAGLRMGEALEKRCAVIQEELNEITEEEPTSSALRKQLSEELSRIGEGCPEAEGPDRTEWFEKKAKELMAATEIPPPLHSHIPLSHLDAQSPAALPTLRWVVVPDIEKLKAAVEAHSKLEWSDKLIPLANTRGEVKTDDASDGTSKIFFFRAGLTCWLPTDVLLEDNVGRWVVVPSLETVKNAVLAHSRLGWDDRMNKLPGVKGKVIEDDPKDGTTKIFFQEPIGLAAWLPTDILTDCKDGSLEVVELPVAKPSQEEPQQAEGGEAKDEQAAPGAEQGEHADSEATTPPRKEQEVSTDSDVAAPPVEGGACPESGATTPPTEEGSLRDSATTPTELDAEAVD